jgi:Ca2+-binding RTX toxin-like protein
LAIKCASAIIANSQFSEYLIDTYHWTINDSNFDGSKTIQGDSTANTLTVTGIKTILHGLGGNDTLIGSTTDDILVGGEGDDTLTGSYGIDVFDYGFKNAGNDTITDRANSLKHQVTISNQISQ